MTARLVVLVALVPMITLTSVAAAGSRAAKQRVAITANVLPVGKAVLTSLGNGARSRLGHVRGQQLAEQEAVRAKRDA